MRSLALAAAVAVAMITIGGLAIRNAQLEQQAAAESAQAAQLAGVLRAAESPGTKRAVLTTPGGQEMAVVLVHNGRRELITVALPPNSADHSYVLWGISNGSAKPIGAFDVPPADTGLHSVGEQRSDACAAYAISLEPGHTPPATPSTVMASGSVTG